MEFLLENDTPGYFDGKPADPTYNYYVVKITEPLPLINILLSWWHTVPGGPLYWRHGAHVHIRPHQRLVIIFRMQRWIYTTRSGLKTIEIPFDEIRQLALRKRRWRGYKIELDLVSGRRRELFHSLRETKQQLLPVLEKLGAILEKPIAAPV